MKLSEITVILLGLAIFLVIYLAPTIVTYRRKKSIFWAMLIANLFFGVTILGWVVCLIVALAVNRDKASIKIELL